MLREQRDVALAESLDARLVTADVRLAKAAASECDVLHLEADPPGSGSAT